MIRSLSVVWVLIGAMAMPSKPLMAADTLSYENWEREEWKNFVFESPEVAQSFLNSRLAEEVAQNGPQSVEMAYALGLAQYLLGDYILSINSYELGLDCLAQKREADQGDDEDVLMSWESAFWNNIGVNWEVLGEFSKAEVALGKSRGLDSDRGDLLGAWTTAINQGLLLSRFESDESAILLLEQAVAYFADIGRSPELGLARLNLAVAQNTANQTEAAELEAENAIELFQSLNDSAGTMSALVTLGQIQLGRSEFDRLHSTLDEMKAWRPAWLSPRIDFYVEILAANDCLHRNLLKEAAEHLERGEELTESSPNLRIDSDYLPTALTLAVARGDVEQAVDLAGRFRKSVTNLFATHRARRLAEYQELNQRNARLARIERLESELRASRWMFFTIAVATGLLFLVAFVRWRAKQFQNRSNRLVFRFVSERIHLLNKGKNSNTTDDDVILLRYREIFQSVQDLVHKKEVHLNPNLTLGELAGLANSNPRYVSNAIRQECGVGFSEYINEMRINLAQNLLLDVENHQLSFEQITERCGFSSTRTFYRQFSRFTNMTPGEFMRLAKISSHDESDSDSSDLSRS